MRNKTESFIRPEECEIVSSGNTAQIIFAENIKEITRLVKTAHRKKSSNEQSETETVFIYDRYTLTVPNREGLFDDVLNNPGEWLEKAKQEEYNKLAAEIRTKRDALLAETDKEFALDRINLNIPEKVTASTMLNTFKDILSVLGSVCSGDMAKYRQALRDIPSQKGFPYDVKYPTKPKGGESNNE